MSNAIGYRFSVICLSALVFPSTPQTSPRADNVPFRPTVDRNGVVELPAARARLDGERLEFVADPGYIGNWVEPKESVAWDFLLPRAGRYLLVIEFATPSGRGGSHFEVEAAGQVCEGFVHDTGGATTFLPQPLVKSFDLEAGRNRLEVRAREVPRGLVMNLRRVRLVPDAE